MTELLTQTELRKMTLPALEAHLAKVEGEITDLSTRSPLAGHWVDSTGGGKHHRLRWYRGRDVDGEEFPAGSRTLADAEVDSIRCRCEAGKRLRVLETQRSRVVEELERKRSLGRKLGLLL
jgi:hypothetical protein